jgi:hypothetical protein
MEMKHPHTTITAGVRQPIVEALEADGNEMAMTADPFESENDRGIESSQLTARPAARETERLGSRLDRDDDFFDEAFLPGGCLYGVAPPSPNETCESLVPPTHGS